MTVRRAVPPLVLCDDEPKLIGMTVGRPRKCYWGLGLEGLHDELRLGRPCTFVDDKVAEVINRALQSKSTGGGTHCTAH